MTTLVIVESPSKAKKIGAMLGAGYVVQASIGHIRDLPTGNACNGYDEKTLQPIYELTDRGHETAKYLKAKFAKCNGVLLATDPDREGEAIAWHVAEVLGIQNRLRVKFHEITDAAIRSAVSNPTRLDECLVKAQEARRIVDRMVGWLVSGPLSRSINERASAGRVQSPSLGLVVEREREIQGFVKKQFFGAVVSFGGWSADWVVPGADGQKCEVRRDAERAAAARSFCVLEFAERDEFEAPPAPFDTAVMQQAASVALGFDPEKTMQIAQKLFQGLEEGHGFITYHRTDDTNLSDDAFAMIQTFAAKEGLPVVVEKRKFKSGVGAQEAHEAIRPTNFQADLTGLSADEAALYRLIHTRAVASQMPDVVFIARRAKLQSDGLVFSAVGRVLKNKGWRAFGVAAEVEDAEDVEEAAPVNPVPLLAAGDTLTATGGKVVEGWTRSPGRYTKASLVKTLKALGIGRPSTYAPSVDGLVKRLYVTLDKRYLVPTPVAGKIYDALTGKFSFIRVDYTKKLEEDLDAITHGKKRYSEVVRGVFDVLHHELAALGGAAAPRAGPVAAVNTQGRAVKCPHCNKPMVVRNGANGAFHGCSTFPRCKGTSPIDAAA
jgi:DNA topoisomerase I